MTSSDFLLSPASSKRRRFVHGLAAAGVSGVLPLALKPGLALAGNVQPAVLSGTEFVLDIASTHVNFTGTPRPATTVNGQIPAPLLRWREGDRITLRVTNRMAVPSSIHWHGILLPNRMDGVPGLTYPGIAPGSTFVYQFDVRQSGTYWYHSHSRFQEQTGLYGPIIIEPKVPDPFTYDRDYVVMLSDWTDEDPEDVFEHLKQMSVYYNYLRPTGAGRCACLYHFRVGDRSLRLRARHACPAHGYGSGSAETGSCSSPDHGRYGDVDGGHERYGYGRYRRHEAR